MLIIQSASCFRRQDNGVRGRGGCQSSYVNHNTSVFSELALRSRMANEAASPSGVELRVTVRDNHSDDDGLPDLLAAVGELNSVLELFHEQFVHHFFDVT